MSLKFGLIQPWTAELAALDQFINLLLENYSKYFDELLSGERSLPFGLLVDNISAPTLLSYNRCVCHILEVLDIYKVFYIFFNQEF